MLENTLSGDNLLFSSSRRHRQRQYKVSKQPNLDSGDPSDPGKRKLFQTLGLVGVVVTVGGGAVVKYLFDHGYFEGNQQEDPYDNWEKYANRSFSSEKVITIGKDLQSSTLPGFPEVGELIVRSQVNPQSMDEYMPRNDPAKKTTIAMADLSKLGFLAMFTPKWNFQGIKMDTVDLTRVAITNRSSGRTEQWFFINPKSVGAEVTFENRLSPFSVAVKRLLAAKEWSHFLYISQLRDRVTKNVLSQYDITGVRQEDLPTLLFINGQEKPLAPQSFPSLGDEFDNSGIDLDGAGYWHIMRAFAQMKDQGLFTPSDLHLLQSQNKALLASKDILIRQSNGRYEWKPGIGPFSPEWTSIMRPIL